MFVTEIDVFPYYLNVNSMKSEIRHVYIAFYLFFGDFSLILTKLTEFIQLIDKVLLM